MARAVPKKAGSAQGCMAVALGSKLRVKREREMKKKKETISCWGLKEKMREQMMMRVERERDEEEEEEEENNQLLGLKEKMRGERAEEVEPNGNGHQEVCEFCTWVCGNSTQFITNAMTTTRAAARILKQPPSPFFTKTLTTVNLSSHVTPSLLIPTLFVETHGDKFESIVSLQVEAATAAAAGGRLGDPPDQSNIGVTIFPTPVVKVFFVHGWNRFASHHDLQKGDNLTFSLVSLSRFLLQIFDNNKVSANSHSTTTATRRRRACCCNSRRSSEDADDHHQCCCRQKQQLQLAGISGPAMTQKNSSSMETTTTTSVVVDDEQRQEVCMSCLSKCSHVTRRRRKKRKMGYGNNNNAMQSVAIVPASATPRFANHTTFPRFTKTLQTRMLYRPELSNASCLVLPKQFWVQYGNKIWKSISLRRLSGEGWPVPVWSDQKLMLISAGWKLFSI